MAYKEKDFQIEFGKWAKHHVKESAAFELKLARTNALPFSALEEHQEFALLVASDNTLFHKIADAGYTNPFDCFSLYKVNAYVVIMYDSDRKNFYMIPIRTWCVERANSNRKSLTKERAEQIGKKYQLSRQQNAPFV